MKCGFKMGCPMGANILRDGWHPPAILLLSPLESQFILSAPFFHSCSISKGCLYNCTLIASFLFDGIFSMFPMSNGFLMCAGYSSCHLLAISSKLSSFLLTESLLLLLRSLYSCIYCWSLDQNLF